MNACGIALLPLLLDLALAAPVVAQTAAPTPTLPVTPMPSATSTPSALLCSAGARDGQPCRIQMDCPDGACVIAQGVCDDGNGFPCDCAGSTCSSDSLTCVGGAFADRPCDPSSACAPGTECLGTQRICVGLGDAGSNLLSAGFSCLVDQQCASMQCRSTGLVCGVGSSYTGFSCGEDSDCCITGSDCPPGICGTVLPTATPTSTTPTPTIPTPTPMTYGSCTDIPCGGTCLIGPVCTPGTRCPKFASYSGICEMVSGTCTCVAAAPPPCFGDCNGDGRVTVDELLLGVNIALGSTPLTACPAFDCNSNCSAGPPPPFSSVSIECLVLGANHALHGCPSGPCKSDQDCDDANPCTIDRCTAAGCVYECFCA